MFMQFSEREKSSLRRLRYGKEKEKNWNKKKFLFMTAAAVRSEYRTRLFLLMAQAAPNEDYLPNKVLRSKF